MTISSINVTAGVCPICHEDYTVKEKADTAKVVELACHHFYHLDCLSPWFALNESRGQNLACCYQCERSSVLKRSHLRVITSETVKRRLAEIKENPDFGSQSEVLYCLAQLEPHANSIANLLNDLIETSNSDASFERFENWIIANVQEELRPIACLLIREVLEKAHTLRSLQQEISHLAAIPMTKWSTAIKEEGVPVYYGEGNNEFRMRVSKDYIQRATCAYLYEDIHNAEKFANNLAVLEQIYDYDQEVLKAIQDTRNFHTAISDTIKEHLSLPIDRVILCLNELIEKTKLNENSKQIIPLIINEIFFQRGALRTLDQEIDRWKKEPIETWPAQIKEQGIHCLDHTNAVMHIDGEKFMGWIKANRRAEQTLAIASEIITSVVTNTVAFIATQIFHSFG